MMKSLGPQLVTILVFVFLGVSEAAGQSVLGMPNTFGNTLVRLNSGDITNDGDFFLENDFEVGQTVYVSREIYMEGNSETGADADQTIYFYDDDLRNRNFFRWDNTRADAACSGTTATVEAMVFDIFDLGATSEAFLFAQEGDIEFKIDDVGNVAMDGTLVQSGSCDLAETFIGESLEPGTVVALDSANLEGVVRSSYAYQPTLVGVVSTEPGMLLNGPTADFYPHAAEMAAVQLALETYPGDEALGERKNTLERMRDSWQRGNTPVALAGRVPVKVDGSYGAIRVGDALTASDTPGRAMAMDRPGATLGVAMEDFDGGLGEILMLVRAGWYVPSEWASASNRRPAGEAADGKREIALRARMKELEMRLARFEDLLGARATQLAREPVAREARATVAVLE